MKDSKFTEKVFLGLMEKAKVFQVGYNYPRQMPDNCTSVKIPDTILDRPDIYDYCQNMCGDKWIWNRPVSDNWTTVYFLNDHDALAFKLRFDTV